jgi:hypothetical protein
LEESISLFLTLVPIVLAYTLNWLDIAFFPVYYWLEPKFTVTIFSIQKLTIYQLRVVLAIYDVFTFEYPANYVLSIFRMM